MFSEAIASRAVGQYPLSVATSLAIESACGVHPDIPVSRPPILSYPELWVNVRTLFRNFIGALDKNAANGIGPGLIADTLLEEMETLTGIIADASQGRSKVEYYVSNYAGMEHKYPHGVLRRDNTDRQKEYTAILNDTVARLLKATNSIKGFELKLTPPQPPTALLLTHYAYDLLSYRDFNKLTLLESHTGAIKERAQWYTKYYQGKELSMIPFREDFIQIFGDNETFRPGDPKLRKDLIAIATKYRWSAVTTYEKIRFGVEKLQNPWARELVLSILVK